jgi:hypothetical protein
MENIVSVPVGPVLHTCKPAWFTRTSQIGLLMAEKLSGNLIYVHFWPLKLTRLISVGKKALIILI